MFLNNNCFANLHRCEYLFMLKIVQVNTLSFPNVVSYANPNTNGNGYVRIINISTGAIANFNATSQQTFSAEVNNTYDTMLGRKWRNRRR